MIRTVRLLLCICCIVFLLAVSTAFADYYTYTDGRGVVTMTNKLESVPAKYRSRVKVIKEDPPAKAAAQQGEPVAEQGPAPASPPDDSVLSKVARFPWVKPVAYVIIAIASFLAINALCSRLRSRHLAKVLYLAFFCGVLLFLYKIYTDQMAGTFLKLKEDATAIVNKTKTRQPPQELVQ